MEQTERMKAAVANAPEDDLLSEVSGSSIDDEDKTKEATHRRLRKLCKVVVK